MQFALMMLSKEEKRDFPAGQVLRMQNKRKDGWHHQLYQEWSTHHCGRTNKFYTSLDPVPTRVEPSGMEHSQSYWPFELRWTDLHWVPAQHPSLFEGCCTYHTHQRGVVSIVLTKTVFYGSHHLLTKSLGQGTESWWSRKESRDLFPFLEFRRESKGHPLQKICVTRHMFHIPTESLVDLFHTSCCGLIDENHVWGIDKSISDHGTVDVCK